MKKTLLILALPFIAATAFAQTAAMPAGQAADSVTKPMPAAGKTRAEVKAEIQTAPKGVARNTDVQSVKTSPDTVASGTTRAAVKEETKRAGAAGEIKKNGALDSIKVGDSGKSTTRAEVKAGIKQDKMAKKDRAGKKTMEKNMEKTSEESTGK